MSPADTNTAKIYEFIKAASCGLGLGATTYEAAVALGLKRNATAGRIAALKKRGYIEARSHRKGGEIYYVTAKPYQAVPLPASLAKPRAPKQVCSGGSCAAQVVHAAPPAYASQPVSPTGLGTKVKTHYILVLDISPSMRELAKVGDYAGGTRADAASKLFNEQLDIYAAATDQESTVSQFEFDYGFAEKCFNTPVAQVRRYGVDRPYPHGSGTSVRDAVIKAGQRAMADGDSEKAFVMMVLTDGEDNGSSRTHADVRQFIEERQATGKWSFVFMVPPGHKQTVMRLCGVPEGNIREWDDLNKVREELKVSTEAFIDERRRTGVKSTKNWWKSDISHITPADLLSLKDVTSDFKIYTVETGLGVQIKEFVDKKTGGKFTPGCAYYEVYKDEDKVASYKDLLILDRSTGRLYSNGVKSVREVCKFPAGDFSLEVFNHSHFVLFTQSTSTNRIIGHGARVAVRKN